MQLALAREVASPGPDLLAVYLPGLDIAQHASWARQAAGSGASTVAARLAALQRYYVALDRLLAPGLAAAARRNRFVVTEPGRIDRHGRAHARVSGARPPRARRAAASPTSCRRFCTRWACRSAGSSRRRPWPLHAGRSRTVSGPRMWRRYGSPSSRPAAAARAAARSGDDRRTTKPGVCQIKSAVRPCGVRCWCGVQGSTRSRMPRALTLGL